MSRAREFLRDPMGPRRWVLMGLCFVVVGSLLHVLRTEQRAWTSEGTITGGATVIIVGIAVEVAVRLWLGISARGRRQA